MPGAALAAGCAALPGALGSREDHGSPLPLSQQLGFALCTAIQALPLSKAL